HEKVESLSAEFETNFDFKESVWMGEKLICPVYSIPNIRDGGYIVVGVKEKENKTLDFTGVEKEHLPSFNGEDLKAKVESFSSSPVNYEIGTGFYKGKNYIVISVAEFTLNPCICRRNGEYKDKILEEGAIYIRTLKDKPSSVKLSNPVDIQDFLDRITDKQIINLHKRGWKHETENIINKSDKSLFEKERKDFE
ncbi:MAG: RNA-binding domain-containing protein, partial [bacterium]